MQPKVFLTGAGPGDPELLTCKAARVIASADVILHDSLVGAAILALAPSARRIDVGKRCGRHPRTQREINRLLVEAALTGACVVRLKGGDPMIFGRLSEEIAALEAHDIPYDVIPGVTAASAAAAALNLSLTKRQVASALHLLSGHGAAETLPAHDWAALARAGGTLAIYMGRETLAGLAAHLIEAGMPPTIPAAAVEHASLPQQRIVCAPLGKLPRRLRGSGGPLIILVGKALRNQDEAAAIAAAAGNPG